MADYLAITFKMQKKDQKHDSVNHHATPDLSNVSMAAQALTPTLLYPLSLTAHKQLLSHPNKSPTLLETPSSQLEKTLSTSKLTILGLTPFDQKRLWPCSLEDVQSISSCSLAIGQAILSFVTFANR